MKTATLPADAASRPDRTALYEWAHRAVFLGDKVLVETRQRRRTVRQWARWRRSLRS